MNANERKVKSQLTTKIENIFGFDLRSLALFRIGLALVILADLIIRAGDLTAHYSDAGVLPRTALIDNILHPWYWSLHLISGQTFVQALIFIFAALMAIGMLVGYRTRLATIASWALIISLHNRNPALIFAADDVLRALLFWAMFLPLGASYSMDSALNSSTKPLPKSIVTGATFALIIQQCFIYMWSAAYKTQSPIWFPDGDAVYYSLSFDQYGTSFGQFLLSFSWLLPILTFAALWFEWLGPLLLFIPWRTSFFRCVAIVSFILLHIGFGLCFELGIFPYLSIVSWLIFIPTGVWDRIAQGISNQQRAGLRIYYDAECGFCKKVVHLLRTFLILPGTPLLVAQDDESIYSDMQEQNSWVVVDWRERRRFKWQAIAYVVSLSPILKPLAKILQLPPLMTIGTKFYETIASNRRLAGKFTAPFKYRPLEVKSSLTLSIIPLLLIAYTTVWNFRNFAIKTLSRDSVITKNLKRKTFNSIDWISRLTRLDQSWSIFAPAPPRDDGWHVISGKLKDGTTIDLLTGKDSVNWEKPTIKQRNTLYPNMQWRTYFINLNRSIGGKLYPYYSSYLCKTWNSQHKNKKQLDSFEVYVIQERTVPPGENQDVKKTSAWKQSCSDNI